MTDVPDLQHPRRIHVVGIGGAGMSAIATVLVRMGHTVSGSDLRGGPVLDRLESMGIEVSVGHEAAHLSPGVDLVTRSTAVPDTNPEVAAAAERGLPVLRRAQVLAAITGVRSTMSVAGTHGKTTTSSMLAVLLHRAGERPSFIIGGELNEIGGGAAWSEDEGWFVVEADESDGTFLELDSAGAIVTSVEPDHLGHYGSFDHLIDAFRRFLTEARGHRIACADDEIAARLAAEVGAFTYGTSQEADLRLGDPHAVGSGMAADVIVDGQVVAGLELPVPGMHNLRNAGAALAAAHLIGVPIERGVEALAGYGGVARRFEHRGEAGGVTFIDDYAHLPTEVRAAVEAARGAGWARIVCVFQPHRYSRTAEVHEQFAGAFDGVDQLVVTDIYSAGEAPRPGVSGRLVADAVESAPGAPPVTYVARRGDLVDAVDGLLAEGTLCLTLGAGDLTTLPDDLVDRRS